MRFAALFAGIAAVLSAQAFASQGLVIHSAEFGVGKFHRLDNKNHPYERSNAWLPYVLPDGASAGQPLVRENADGSVTVFFSTLDELIASVVKLSHDRHQQVSVLNVHGHGLPGGMWFPKDAATLNSWECGDWNDAANGSDQGNYDQYYSAVSADEVMQIRQISNSPSSFQMGCTTGLDEWKGGVAKTPAFKTVFADDAQIHFLSCVVGLGKAGEAFTQGIAGLLLKPGQTGRVETSIDFGLGDWSMPAGMGFWDYQSDAQLDHDNSIYPVDRKDAEIAQKGTIRMVTSTAGAWSSTLLGNRDEMRLGFEASVRGTPVPELVAPLGEQFFTQPLPSRVRVPGTAAYVEVKVGPTFW